MFILSIVLLIAVIVYFFLCKKNTITYLIAINILSAYAMMFFSVLYASKLATYVTPSGYDYQIYRWLFGKLNLHIWTICRLFNYSLIVYFVSNIIFCVKLNGKRFSVSVLLMIFSVVFYFVWNSVEVSQMIYIYIQNVENTRLICEDVVKYLNIVSIVLIIMSVLMPLVHAAIYAHKTKIITKRNDAVAYLLCMGIISLFVMRIIFNDEICKNLILNEYKFFIPHFSAFMNKDFSSSMFFWGLTVLIVISILYFKLYDVNLVNSIYNFFYREANLNAYLSTILHTYKNAFICIENYTEFTKNPDDVEGHIHDKERIKAIAEKNISQIQRFINEFREKNFLLKVVSLKECVEAAIKNIAFAEDVKIHRSFCENDVFVRVDSESFTEVIINILINADEALKKSGKDEKKIKIEIGFEEKTAFVNIIDNGEGIKVKNKGHIFDYSYSTKALSSGGGVGLYYVKKTMVAMGGSVSVSSKEGEYCLFQLAMPSYCKTQIMG